MSDFLSNLWSRSRGDTVGVKPRLPSRFDPPATNLGGESPLPIELDVEHDASSYRPAPATTPDRVGPEKTRDAAPPQEKHGVELRPIMPERPRPTAPRQRGDEQSVIENEVSEDSFRVPSAPAREPAMIGNATTISDEAPRERVIRSTSPASKPAQPHAEESPAPRPISMPTRQPRHEVEQGGDTPSRYSTSDPATIAEVSPAPPPWSTSQAAPSATQQVPESPVTEILDSRVTEVAASRVTEVAASRVTEVPDSRVTEVPDSRVTNDPKSIVEYRGETVAKVVPGFPSSLRPRLGAPVAVPVKATVARSSEVPHDHSSRASAPAAVEVPEPSPPPPEPVVQVTIGRIEIRAVTPTAAQRGRPAPAVMSLTDYLKHRAEGARR